MTNSKAGRIVWHDLFTSDRERSIAFYERVANWTYQVERATDFAWGGGEKDFVLALSGDEAGAGFAETPPNLENGWIAYIEVPDVDAAVKRAGTLGGRIVRQPFEVPGVGRNSLIRDPRGALLGVSLSRHSFPVPRRQFGPEIYLTSTDDFPARFYSEIFKWRVSPKRSKDGRSILGPSGELVAFQYATPSTEGLNATWVPCIKVSSVPDAYRFSEADGARPLLPGIRETVRDQNIIRYDPEGVLFALSGAQTNNC